MIEALVSAVVSDKTRPAVALSILANVFNTLERDSPLRHKTFAAMVSYAVETNTVSLLAPQVGGAGVRWCVLSIAVGRVSGVCILLELLMFSTDPPPLSPFRLDGASERPVGRVGHRH